jgi:spoIIIJ-associated protein
MDASQNQKLKELIQTVTGHMHIPCDVSVQAADDASPISIDIQAAENAKLLIGKDGQNLKALEHLVRAFWVRHNGQARSIVVDINDYRKEKSAQVIELVRQAATRVRDTRRSEALPPMSSYERRLAHTELASWSEVATESVGQEPQRRVVIKPL